ncbi:MAG TPA: AmmeMemoRadiSam system protein B [Anaerolineae bacterium]|nr:AmmeMemoRadiSam system protein B [Anaerolineae bacterium]
MTEKPQLRPLDFQQVQHQGQPMWYLRDPMKLTDYQLLMPPALAQILLFCDGTRDIDEIHEALCDHLNAPINYDIVVDTIAQLDEACLLENERSRKARADLRQAYRMQPCRPAALAGLSYPETPAVLTHLLDSYAAEDNLNGWEPRYGRAIVAPHIDYQRGGPVYAKTYRRAEAAILNADLILVFGTDHNGGPGTFTLTKQPYATPYGVLPTDPDLIDALAAAIGQDAAFAEELNHRQEHSVELAAVWLHYIYQRAGVPPKPMIPILCGSFHHFVVNGRHPTQDPRLTAAIQTLKEQTAGKRVFSVASVDFAHVGPAFSDSFNMDEARRAALKQSDFNLVQAILRGDESLFYDQIAAVQDRHRICGFSSIYLMLDYLGSAEGLHIAYDQCPADEQNNSLVSIAGILLE